MSYTVANPVTVGNATKKSDYDTLFANAAALPRPLSRTTSDAANVGTGETTLKTYTLPAGYLANAGDGVRIRVVGIAANNTNTKTYKLYFGATVIATVVNAVAANQHWVMEGEIWRSSPTVQMAWGMWEGVNTGMQNLITAPAETLSGTIVIKMTGQSGTGSNDITSKAWSVELVPAA